MSLLSATHSCSLGSFTVSLTVIDDRVWHLQQRLTRLISPTPVPDLDFSCPGLNGTVLSGIPQNQDGVVWMVLRQQMVMLSFLQGDPIRFDGSSSYDADPEFVGRTSTDQQSSEWNGIVSWIWDFEMPVPRNMGP